MQPLKSCQPHNPSPQRESGMTLVEVMVAMFILTVVSVAGLNLLTTGTDNLLHREKVLLASIVAHNKMVELRLGNFSTAGETKGRETQSGQDFPWKMNLSKTLNRNFLQAEVSVFDPQAAEFPLHSLVALVPSP